jgi:phosphoribosylglycinamide formyltransferase-1
MTEAALHPKASLPVVILLSGRGSNMCALSDAAIRGELPIDIRAVVSDRANAPGLERARERNITVASLSPREFASREAFDERLADLVDGFSPQLVLLAGYMRILSPAFVHRYDGRLLNIHPSLLPKYPGLHTHRRALEAGDKEHGASVHFVIDALDSGPVLIQGRVPVEPADDESTLAARVHRVEHMIYPQAVAWFALGRVAVRAGRVWLDDRELISPPVIDIPL